MARGESARARPTEIKWNLSITHISVTVREISQRSSFTNSNNYVAVLERKGIRMRDIATHQESTSRCVKPF